MKNRPHTMSTTFDIDSSERLLAHCIGVISAPDLTVKQLTAAADDLVEECGKLLVEVKRLRAEVDEMAAAGRTVVESADEMRQKWDEIETGLRGEVEELRRTIAEVRAEQATICVAVGLPPDDPAPNVIEQIRRRAVALSASRSAHETTVGVSLRLDALNADLTAQVDELRLTLAAEQGRPEGAPSDGWRFLLGRWSKDLPNGDRLMVDRHFWCLEYTYEDNNGYHRTAIRQDPEGRPIMGRAENDRAAMIAADEKETP